MSGDYSRVKDFRTQLHVLYSYPGGMVPGNTIQRISATVGTCRTDCCQWEIDTFSATVTQGINFLSELYGNNNLSYSAMNTARSALSLVIFPPEGCTLGRRFYNKTIIIATISLCVEYSDRAKLLK